MNEIGQTHRVSPTVIDPARHSRPYGPLPVFKGHDWITGPSAEEDDDMEGEVVPQQKVEQEVWKAAPRRDISTDGEGPIRIQKGRCPVPQAAPWRLIHPWFRRWWFVPDPRAKAAGPAACAGENGRILESTGTQR